MMLVAIVFGTANGRLADITSALMSGAEDAVKMTLSLVGIMSFWTGIMKIAEGTGVTSAISKLLRPLTKLLFPKLKDKKALDAIVMNMTANMLGMSNAATPLGLKAMDCLKKYSDGTNATDEMCMFAVINTASIQLIPSTIIALRQSAGSLNPTEIIVAVWLTSITALTVGVTTAKLMTKSLPCVKGGGFAKRTRRDCTSTKATEGL